MNTTITIIGKSEMKGRNGYSSLGQAQYVMLPNVGDQPELHYIDFFSKRGSDEPPARLVLSREDAIAFKEWVAQLPIGEQTTCLP
jgi:hypothetical protein